MKLLNSLSLNIKKLKDKLKSDDISFMDIKNKNLTAVLIFANELCDKKSIGDLILKPLINLDNVPTENQLLDLFLSPEKKTVYSILQVVAEVVSGNAVLVAQGFSVAFSFGLKKYEKRTITEPPTSTVIKGPREGFVENLPVNISLVRRRLKTPNLIIENLKVGKYSDTDVALCYVDDIADLKLVKTLKHKLKQIEIDAILDSSYISKFLGEHRTSIFKQVGNTEKPDILVARILEGRVAIMVDGSPIALTIPYLLLEDFQSPSDYYTSSYNATTARILRLISVFIALLLPAFFLAAELFHLQLIPLSFLLTIVNSIKGIPLSPSYEMFFTLLIFEVLNEASVRMPKYVGMVVSIVGGLVLGETAVTAGIISAPTLMIVALSGICLYTVPELEKSFSLIRILLLLIGGSVGGYGLILSMAFITVYLVSFESYNTPLLAPFSPIVIKDLQDGVYKGFMLKNNFRPQSLNNKNKKRLKKDN